LEYPLLQVVARGKGEAGPPSEPNAGLQEQALAFQEASKYVIIVISMLPVMIIYPFAQRYFIKGIMIGAIKG
jgi:putative aldouronate transport system permease protein